MHTKGQWTFSRNAKEIWTSDGGKTIAKLGYGDSVIPRFPSEIAEQNANGFLIAAAPAMLEALKDVRALIDDGVLVHDISSGPAMIKFAVTLNKIQAAIAAAGEDK